MAFGTSGPEAEEAEVAGEVADVVDAAPPGGGCPAPPLRLLGAP